METKARLVVDELDLKMADLYLPVKVWKELVKRRGTNRLTVVLRFE